MKHFVSVFYYNGEIKAKFRCDVAGTAKRDATKYADANPEHECKILVNTSIKSFELELKRVQKGSGGDQG
jgi:hypothetical protein